MISYDVTKKQIEKFFINKIGSNVKCKSYIINKNKYPNSEYGPVFDIELYFTISLDDIIKNEKFLRLSMSWLMDFYDMGEITRIKIRCLFENNYIEQLEDYFLFI